MKEWSNVNYMLQRSVNIKQTSLNSLREEKDTKKTAEIEKNPSPIYIESFAEGLKELSKNRYHHVKYKLDKFVDVFNDEFSIKSNPKEAGRAAGITWALMDGPIFLYAHNMNGSAIIELHAILERFSIRTIVEQTATPSKRKIALKIVERRTLPDSASILLDLGILNKEDVKFVTKLSSLRNGIAHKNPEKISKLVCSGKKTSMLDIDSTMEKYDCLPLIIRATHLLIKMSKADKAK